MRAYAVAPEHMQRWSEILQGEHADHMFWLFSTEVFLDLPQPEQAWWDQLIQSAPFAPVLGARLRNQQKRKKKLNESAPTAMTLEQFDHICRAAAAVAGVRKVHVFGANAIIPWLVEAGLPMPLPNFQPSRELDVSVGDERLETLIDGAIGELSVFDETFSVYAHGVSLVTFQAPLNWQKRAGKRIEPVSGVEIVAPHPHDLIISKLVAGRPKDFDFAISAAKLFPMTEDDLNVLVQEFQRAHPQAVDQLRRHLEIWRQRRQTA